MFGSGKIFRMGGIWGRRGASGRGECSLDIQFAYFVQVPHYEIGDHDSELGGGCLHGNTDPARASAWACARDVHLLGGAAGSDGSVRRSGLGG